MQLGLYRTTLAAARLYSELKVSRLGKMTSCGMKSRPERNSSNSPISFTVKEQGQSQSWDQSQGAYEEEFPPLSANISSMQGKRRTRVDLQTSSEHKSEVVQNIASSQVEAFTSISDKNDTDLSTSFGKKRSSSPRNPGHLQTSSEHRSEVVQNIGPSQVEASTLISDKNDTDLPTSFGKKRSSSPRNPGHLQTSSEHKSEVVQNIGPLQVEASTSISDKNDTDLPTSFGKKRSSSPRNPGHRQIYHEHWEAKRSSMSALGTTVSEPFDICLPETGESNSNSLRSNMNGKNREKWVPKVQPAEGNEPNEDNMEERSIEGSVQENGQVLRPGMVLLKYYIPLSQQVDIVNRCQELGLGPGGFYRPGYNDGAKLRLYMMCLGLDWNPQTRTYGKRRHHDNVAPPDIPQEFTSLVHRVLNDSHTLIKKDLSVINVEDILPAMSPDVCIVNFYTTNGRLGLHQDRDESPDSLLKRFPVVSISVGDSAEFLYGDQRDVDKADSLLLESGDVLIFGGESRHIFHGVKTIIPDTAPPALLKTTKLRPGRLNLTFRKY